MFIYCFDLKEKEKLQTQLKLFKESIVDNKQCWIFCIDKSNQFNFDCIDQTKCLITNKMIF